MKKTRLPTWGKVLIGLVVVAGAWVAFRERPGSARVDELAALPPCGLAAAYMEWRLAFEDANPGEVSESAADAFTAESEIFERAVRSAEHLEQSSLLQELETLTSVDSASWVREEHDVDPFVQIMLAECPDEVQELISRTQR